MQPTNGPTRRNQKIHRIVLLALIHFALRMAIPTERASADTYDPGVVEYRLPIDLLGELRNDGLVISGAVTR